MDAELLQVILKQIPSNMLGAAILALLFLYAVKARWIPLSVSWGEKKIIRAEQPHYITEEVLLKHCKNRQDDLDNSMDKKFGEVFKLLRSIEKKVDEGMRDMTAKIADHATEIAVLKERSSHHRKDDLT